MPGLHFRHRGAWQLLPGYFVVFTLTLLLTGTTPMGTGVGVHQFDLVHPLFTHLHLVDGRWLTHEQLAQTQPAQAQSQPPPSGPALGAGAGSAQSDLGLGVSPVVPAPASGVMGAGFQRVRRAEVERPLGRVDAPPDPPPTSIIRSA